MQGGARTDLSLPLLTPAALTLCSLGLSPRGGRPGIHAPTAWAQFLLLGGPRHKAPAGKRPASQMYSGAHGRDPTPRENSPLA